MVTRKKMENDTSVVPVSSRDEAPVEKRKTTSTTTRRKRKTPPRKTVAEMRAEAAARDRTVPRTVDQRMAAPVRKPVSKSKTKRSIAKQIVAQMAIRDADESVPKRKAKRVLPKGPSRFSDQDLEDFRKELLYIRGRILKKIHNLRLHTLKPANGSAHEEEGTEAYERFSSIERSSGDQDILYHIDEALRAIQDGTYGVCKNCGSLIQKPRLQALPFAKHCIHCQAELERKYLR